jgi:predicted enzyme related to lactoylglutathione lyase
MGPTGSQEATMISRVRTVGVFVSDQDRARDFYVTQLGFEVRSDEPMGPPGSPRWLEIAPAGAETALVLFTPPGSEDRIGMFTGYVLACDDLRATHRELTAAGVRFTEEPTEQPWGLWAQFQDPDNNTFELVQRGD